MLIIYCETQKITIPVITYNYLMIGSWLVKNFHIHKYFVTQPFLGYINLYYYEYNFLTYKSCAYYLTCKTLNTLILLNHTITHQHNKIKTMQIFPLRWILSTQQIHPNKTGKVLFSWPLLLFGFQRVYFYFPIYIKKTIPFHEH